MKKYLILLLIAISLSVSFVLTSHTEAGKLALSDPTPKPSVKIEKVELDRTEVFIACPPGTRLMPGAVCAEKSSIEVKVSVVNPKKKALSYNYIVSGGRITGQGANVTWDLIGVRPGNYTITAAIDDGSALAAETKTTVIEVRDCRCGNEDACPVIDISTPADRVKTGETATFTAKLTGISASDLTYQWSISSGTIIEGQGTPTIRVETTPDMENTTLTATVEPQGPTVGSFCEASASKTILITK